MGRVHNSWRRRTSVRVGASALALAALLTSTLVGTAPPVGAQPSATALQPVVNEAGMISLSVDGLGTNDPAGGTIDVQKAPGATVRTAILVAASTGFRGYTPVDGDVTIDGTPVSWDPTRTIPNAINSFNVLADVTAIVKPKIDAAPAGLVSFQVAEPNNPGLIEGEILAVVLDDPTVTVNSSVILVYGAQNTAGDTFNIGLAEPIDTSDPDFAITFGLGISFGFQPTSQFSQVDVNGTRLTTSAGGQDDGVAENGALLTVGGLGDSTTNPPDPLATGGDPTCPRCDDELYDLLPFVNDGDTSITIDTLNPSNDDNIFFASLVFNSAAAVVGEGALLTPATATNFVDTPHTVTAALQDTNGDPIVGRTVTFTVTSGPNAGLTGTDDTDAAGIATFTYTSTATGTDTIEASFLSPGSDSEPVTITSNSVTKTWVGAPSAVLTPTSATNEVSTPHTVTATLQDGNGDPIAGRTVTFTVTAGPNAGVAGTDDTDAAGVATFTYTSTATGTDTIVATFEEPGTDSGPITITSNSVTKTWVDTAPPPGPGCGFPAGADGDFLFAVPRSQILPGGLSVRNEDVVRFDAATGTYAIFFDGSDVGIRDLAVDAVALDGCDLLLSFVSSGRVPGLGGVHDEDVVRFTGTFGPTTTGTFDLFFDGSDIGLRTSNGGEDVDAIEFVDGDLYVSTKGSFSVRSGANSASGRDEDVFVCSGLVSGPDTSCVDLAVPFRGAPAGLTRSSEDVDAVSLDAGRAFFSTTGSYSVLGASGSGGDVFRCDGPLSTCDDAGTVFTEVFSGTFGNIFDVEFGIGPPGP